MFLMLGVLTGFGTFIQTFMFNNAGVRLTSRLRIDTFTAMLGQEMAWFDDGKNAVGALCARLAGDCARYVGFLKNEFAFMFIDVTVSKEQLVPE